jgi:hypothetical protein
LIKGFEEKETKYIFYGFEKFTFKIEKNMSEDEIISDSS